MDQRMSNFDSTLSKLSWSHDYWGHAGETFVKRRKAEGTSYTTSREGLTAIIIPSIPNRATMSLCRVLKSDITVDYRHGKLVLKLLC